MTHGDGTKPEGGESEEARRDSAAHLKAAILCGHYSLVAGFVAGAVAEGWRLFHNEDNSIVGGERVWWSLVSPRTVRPDASPDLTHFGKLKVSKGGRATELVHLIGEQAEHIELNEALARDWRLRLLGFDGGWGGEPYYEVRRRAGPK